MSIPTRLLNDEQLSWKARGLAAFILAKPDAWRVDARALARCGPDGRDAILTGLTELEKAGYLVRRRGQGVDGRWWSESVLYEDPADAATDGDNPQDGDEAGDNPAEVGIPHPGSPDPGSPDPSSLPERDIPPTPPAGGTPTTATARPKGRTAVGGTTAPRAPRLPAAEDLNAAQPELDPEVGRAGIEAARAARARALGALVETEAAAC